MTEKRYVLSRYVRVSDATQLAISDGQGGASGDNGNAGARLEGKFVLFDERRSKVYVVNPVIKTFLCLLETPRTRNELVHDLAVQANCRPDEVSGTIASFLRKMIRKRIVLEEGTEAPMKKGPLFEKGGAIGKHQVKEILAVRPDVDVYVAEPVDGAGADVVLKVFKAQPGMSRKAVARRRSWFEQEFELMRMLEQHENVCRLLDFVYGEHPHAVLEYADGESLYDLAEETGYTLAYRLSTAAQVLRAIAHLHRHEVIHGDIHDSNFVLTASGCVKLIDFGFAFHRELHADRRTPYGGVTYFIPPERVMPGAFEVSRGPGNTCSEVHQLGVVLYGLLAGRMPFSGLLWGDLVRSIQQDIPALLFVTPEGETIPGVYADIVAKALQKAPAARYPSAMEMSEAWERADALSMAATRPMKLRTENREMCRGSAP